MKELQDKIIDQQEIAKPVPTEKKLLGSMKLQRGHKFWELNHETGEITEAKVNWVAGIDGRKRGALNASPGNYYCSALNIKNAKKHFGNLILRQYAIQQRLKAMKHETTGQEGVGERQP